MSYRPSNVPKFLECGAYEGEKASGEAAVRGTMLDEAYRLAISKGEKTEGLTPLDRESLEWAVDITKLFSKGHPIETDEDKCHVVIPGFENGGTLDAKIMGARLGIDLKSGQPRDYTGQMAAYALGCMEEAFVDEWDMVIIYLDHRAWRKYTFGRSECEELLAIADKNYKANTLKTNEYCKWCSKFEWCQAVVDDVESATSIGPITMAQIEKSNDLLVSFLNQMGIAKEYEARVKGRIKSDKRDLPGYAITKDYRAGRVKPEILWSCLERKEITKEEFLALMSPAKETDVQVLFKTKNLDLPSDYIVETHRAGQLRKKAVTRKQPAESSATTK